MPKGKKKRPPLVGGGGKNPTIRKECSELWFDWNPHNPADPVNNLLRGEAPPPNSMVVEANYNNNDWFPDVLRQEMLYDKHVWEGGYLDIVEGMFSPKKKKGKAKAKGTKKGY